MKQSRATTSQSSYTKTANVLPLSKASAWSPSEDYKSSWDGGGSDMETRVSILENDVKHIKTDIGEIKTDIREVRNYIWGILGLGIVGFSGMYMFINSGTSSIIDDIHEIKIELQKKSMADGYTDRDLREVKSDIKEIKDMLIKTPAKN
ncbi:hypothetical protein W03_09710 [Nitrosomonas sp. PY1]|uniref:hypothetical protein n=1 Tax=Nitrosomonas sp. PY1 TaxID=1803906 RepID=UPI001FC7DD58|nr:hypothetical protein [Nitrosomonas sp. PY1]GKS68967.1 hypothetical protein W03_09710 [Nitrosomonas sp. PY1]